MLQIKFNKTLFDMHIDKTLHKIKELFENIDDSDLKQIDKECLSYIKDNLKDILEANNSKMKEYIKYFEKNFPNSIGKKDTKKEDWKRIYKILRNDIFGKEYDNWTKRTTYGAYKFVQDLNLKSCPYCNRNYTFVIDEENGKLRPEIDHFYPKSIYPFLAMSFYNLIPSCSICNHTKKEKIDLDLINPYEIKENDFKLTYTPNDINFFNIEKERYDFDSFEIDFVSANKNIETFKLKELYKQHKDIVLELLIKKAYYPKSYIEELKSFGFAEDEIYRYLLGNYKKDEDLHKRPLSKLIKDISEELELI
ncbi:hypothetical protein [Halarcobacter ebronensis]|uniref:HNH nuclease domain-containing protein n=1 Tax=Halarcobacter ebronensis TaxID=1462615 RepID=A0A4Q1AL51_9BACT|nr:hypothetical protein [Halarcobacter ebronensis]QKF83069.1 hypothetical protein AEBR_2613 [Halarcobacter ebronensis]RXK02416.1 hypothetical protein CRV07_13810 [Halarcobacter ebronensis]